MKRVIPWIAITLATIIMYHFIIIGDINGMIDQKNDSEIALVGVNPITNVITVKYSGDNSIVRGMLILFSFVGEKALETKAREQFDVYAMIIPYKIVIK